MPDSAHHPHKTNIKETLTSVIIAFALAFVFRGFVVEAFLIPTGSMAPTLMGAHERVQNPDTGYSWAVGPWQDLPNGAPSPIQKGVEVNDPLTGQRMPRMDLPSRAGDRIFVMKYLYSVYDPERFDVVVFKNPTDPNVNFIKRLLGLPGEQIALVDGDLFVRTPKAGEAHTENPWLLDGWSIARKPELAQRALWQKVFDSEFMPVGVKAAGVKNPWLPDSPGWDFSAGHEYTFTGNGPTRLTWDSNSRPLRDGYAYNQIPQAFSVMGQYPVADLAVSVGLRPTAADAGVSMLVTARGHEFRIDVNGQTVDLRMRPQPMARADGTPDSAPMVTLGSGKLAKPLTPGEVCNLELWHVDQSLQLWQDGRQIAQAPYAWSIDQRLTNALVCGSRWKDEVTNVPTYLVYTPADLNPKYKAPTLALEFRGGALTLTRLTLARDVFYQPAIYSTGNRPGVAHRYQGAPALATSPSCTLSLTNAQFFCCGDNSPASLDGRLWDSPDPWVAKLDPTMGVVNRDLLIGKAFFVYFPAPAWRGPVPIPDFGRMRFIF